MSWSHPVRHHLRLVKPLNYPHTYHVSLFRLKQPTLSGRIAIQFSWFLSKKALSRRLQSVGDYEEKWDM